MFERLRVSSLFLYRKGKKKKDFSKNELTSHWKTHNMVIKSYNYILVLFLSRETEGSGPMTSRQRVYTNTVPIPANAYERLEDENEEVSYVEPSFFWIRKKRALLR